MKDNQEKSCADREREKFEPKSEVIDKIIKDLDQKIAGTLKEMDPSRDKLVWQHREAIKILRYIASSPKLVKKHYKKICAIINNFEFVRNFYLSGITFPNEKYLEETIAVIRGMLKRHNLEINSKNEIVEKTLPGKC